MSATLILATLPLIAFSAHVSNGELRVLEAAGGTLELFGAAAAPAGWLSKAIHPDERAAFLSPPQGESRQLIRLPASDATWRWFNLRINEIDESRRDEGELHYTARLTDATEFKAMEEIAQRYRDYTELGCARQNTLGRPVGKGTGMGLSMCFGIVADHAGRIEVQSTPGAGSSFRVSLPENLEQKTV